MRFADGPRTEVDVRIDAPPPRVWTLVTDIAVPAEFSTEFQGGEWLEDTGRPALGARFRGRNKREAVEWETTSIIIACDENRAFAWAVGDDPASAGATWEFTLTPDGDGTILTYSVRLGPGPSGLTYAIEQRPDKEERIIENRLTELGANMTATIEGIKKLAEDS